MYHMSSQGVDEHMINVIYYYYYDGQRMKVARENAMVIEWLENLKQR